MSKKAILITGQLRFRNEVRFKLFSDIIKGYDIFISTYTDYKNIAQKLTNNIIFLDTHPDYKTTYQTNMYQWFHLQNLIRKYEDNLSQYDILYRLRTDINIPTQLFNKTVNKRTIYSIRDFLFFGESIHFINIFKNFFDEILNKYYGIKQQRYFNINYSNFINTIKPTYRWDWITYPRCIFSKNFNTLKANIISHMDKLNDINANKTTCNFITHLPSVIIKNSHFSSEKIFPLHCINNGYIEGIDLKIKLYPERKKFKYGISAPEQENTA